jgi:hypothetical protein
MFKKIKSLYPRLSDHSIDLICSSMSDENPFMNTEDFFKWLNNLNTQVTFETEFISLKEIKDWGFDKYGNIRHKSGNFFVLRD